MATASVASAPPKTAAAKLAARQPVAIATAAVTLLSTAMFVAPSVGIKIPNAAAKVLALVLFVASGFGVRSLVTPVAAPNLPAAKAR